MSDPTCPGPGEWPDVGNDEIPCCIGSAHDGPTACTCWHPEFDAEQATLKAGEPATRGTRCGDCAYRRDSPERTDAPDVGADYDDLLHLAATGKPFYCHDGVRRPTQWRHPSGATVPGNPVDYRPPIVNGIPYRVDGSPALLCAGWAAHTTKHNHEDTQNV